MKGGGGMRENLRGCRRVKSEDEGKGRKTCAPDNTTFLKRLSRSSLILPFFPVHPL
jgi:hypothetical protein